MTIKVMHLISGFSLGGAERNVYNLVSDDTDQGIEYSIAYRRQQGEMDSRFEKLGVPMHLLRRGRHAMINPLRWLEVGELIRLLRQERIDILHSHMPPSLLYGPMAARRAGVISVASIHAMRSQLTWIQYVQAVLMKRKIDWFIEGSQGVCDDLVQHGISKSHILQVPYGVDAELFGKDQPRLRQEFREEYGIAANDFVLGRVARFHPDKGFDLLVEMVPLLAQRIPELKVVLVGDGEHWSLLQNRVHELGIRDRVVFTGFYHDSHRALAAFDVVGITARAEALSISSLEALAAGKSFIFYDVGGLTEGIRHNHNGLAVPFGDTERFVQSVYTIYKDTKLRQRLETNSRALFESRFSLTAMRTAMANAYREIKK